MPVDSKHPEYVENATKWKKCRDAFSGEEAVKAADTLYLPALSGQTPFEYGAYKRRASFFSATRRTVLSMVGLVLKQETDIVAPTASDGSYGQVNMGLNSEPVELLTQQTLTETLTVGRVGLLVDLDTEGTPRPYVALYIAEAIYNWSTARINGREVLSMVMLHEPALEPVEGDDYDWQTTNYFRELYLDGGIYKVRRWKQVVRKGVKGTNGGKDTPDSVEFEKVGAEITPRARGGLPFTEIPFTFCSPAGLTVCVEDPPVLDLVNVNLSHYRNSADLEHGLHYTALPTAWVKGFEMKGATLKIGSADAWVTDNTDAEVGYLEFTGQGLAAIEKQMDRKEAQMAVLGARMLEAPKKGIESADAINLRAAGEQGVLASTAITVSAAWTRALMWVAQFAGDKTNKYHLTLGTDFGTAAMDAAMFTALSGAVDSGKLSWETFFYNCQQSGLYPDNLTPEEEQERIAAGNESRATLPTEKGPKPISTETPEELAPIEDGNGGDGEGEDEPTPTEGD